MSAHTEVGLYFYEKDVARQNKAADGGNIEKDLSEPASWITMLLLAVAGDILAFFIRNKISFHPMDLLAMSDFISLPGVVVRKCHSSCTASLQWRKGRTVRQGGFSAGAQATNQTVRVRTLTMSSGMFP
ncbi:MAG: hypothetical protein A2W28_11520 [Gammaproteobacteria bacterium RBG_16_51_14]|nr:MAG: hypothetical protein A2W28_11520 [Gammaproteobacteria bacterium RBG_16_51_14]